MTKQEADELITRVRTKGSYIGDYYMSFTDSSTPFNKDVDILADALQKQIHEKCEYCDTNSENCQYFQDSLTDDWYLEVRTSEWDDYNDDWVYDKIWGVKYCQYCGKKLDEARTI